jgi:antitoxin component of RelBE/YafQ-DinJ toxin-antitoxin module
MAVTTLTTPQEEEKKKKPKRIRTEFIRARVKPNEKVRFEKLCEDSGLSPSDYIRKKILEEEPLPKLKRKKSASEIELSEVLHFANKSSNNINQIARALNRALLEANYTSTNFLKTLEQYQKLITEAKEGLDDVRSLIREKLLTGDLTR